MVPNTAHMLMPNRVLNNYGANVNTKYGTNANAKYGANGYTKYGAYDVEYGAKW